VEVLLEALMADQHVAYKQVSNLGGGLVETFTLPETNIALENSHSQKEIHLPTINFPGPC